MAARLNSVPLRDLGRFGYYSESEGRYDDLRVASSLTNCVFDKNGKVASRQGYANVLTSSISGTPDVEQMFYYRKEIGETDFWIAAANKKLYKVEGTVGAGTATDITGAITAPTATKWQFVNYNNKVVGIQQGDNPIGWDGTGNFADWGSGTLPDGNAILAAWGRVFASTADGQTVRWTATLGEDFDAVGAGALNVRLVWPNGKDRIVALVAFSNRLIIFGKKTILIYRDATATQLSAGLNPNSTGFSLEESIGGVGCYARDTIEAVGDDLLFLSEDGIRSLSRALEYDKLPMQTLSRNIDLELADILPLIDVDECKAVYHQSKAMYLLRLENFYYYLDVREPIRDNAEGKIAPILRASQWTGINWKSAWSGEDGNLRFGFASGKIGEHDTYLDGAATYTMDQGTVWMSFDSDTLKFLKRFVIYCNTDQSYQVTFRWAWDFSNTFTTRSVTVNQSAAPAEWNLAEWGNSEWSGDADSVFIGRAHGAGSGTYLKFGWSVQVNDSKFSFNSLLLQLKTGRISR